MLKAVLFDLDGTLLPMNEEEFTKGYFTKWSGIVLNIIIYALVTIFMYLILKKLFKDDKNSNIKALILAFMSSITLASCSNVLYIRMYALLTLEILITIFLHIFHI